MYFKVSGRSCCCAVLEDCGPDQGTFQCVPGFQTKYEAWREGASEAELDEVMSSNRVPRTPEFQPTVVPGKAGDLLIWDVRAPAAISRPCCSCGTG